MDLTFKMDIYLLKKLSRQSRQIGSEITFSILKEKLYFFDKNGDRIYDENQIEVIYEEFKRSWD